MGFFQRLFGSDKVFEKGTLQHVTSLIENGADVNAIDDLGLTALMWASINGDAKAVRKLIEAKADVNTKNNNGATALLTAAGVGNTEIVRLLIKAGADMNARDNLGRTMLMIAHRHTKTVRVLKEAGAK